MVPMKPAKLHSAPAPSSPSRSLQLYPRAETALHARRISGWVSAHDVAARLRTDHSRIVDIRRAALKRFSLEMLLRLSVHPNNCVPHSI
jgi:hypothetical protein